jgi:parallel beta-helix repeat protein
MNKFWLTIFIFLLAASFTISSEGKTIIVDQDGDGGDFETLGSAVASANPGDKINIRSGTYVGGVIIDRKISIYGEPGQVTLAGGGDNILRVGAPGCEISNISIRGGGDKIGVLLESSDNLISDCTILDCETAILITGSGNSIRDNLIDSECGVAVIGASGNEIIENIFKGELGVRLEGASDNVVERCNFSVSIGTELGGTSENRLEDNSFDCSKNAVILDKSVADRIIRNSITGGSGILITDSEKSSVCENNISNCQAGLKIVNTVGGNLTDNDIIGCFVGLDLDKSSLNTITGNDIVGCSAGVGAMGCKIGIRLKNSDNNSLLLNELELNEIAGIYLENSRLNLLQENLAIQSGNGLLLK